MRAAEIKSRLKKIEEASPRAVGILERLPGKKGGRVLLTMSGKTKTFSGRGKALSAVKNCSVIVVKVRKKTKEEKNAEFGTKKDHGNL